MEVVIMVLWISGLNGGLIVGVVVVVLFIVIIVVIVVWYFRWGLFDIFLCYCRIYIIYVFIIFWILVDERIKII